MGREPFLLTKDFNEGGIVPRCGRFKSFVS